MKQKAWIGLLLFFAVLAAPFLLREVWFDEFLTLQIAQTKDSLSGIYHAYQIPNNHIVFTMLLSLWLKLTGAVSDTFPMFAVRILPLLCGGAALLVLFRFLHKKAGVRAAVFCTVSLGTSAAFLIYATALRGYMTGLLTVLLAFAAGWSYLRKGKLKMLILYTAFSLLSVGVAPTNLAALTAVAVYLAPCFLEKQSRVRWILLFCIPFLCLIAFYYPIRDMFFGCIRLGEGWSSAPAALWHLYGSALLLFLPLLCFAVPGIVKLWKKQRSRLFVISSLLIILIPAGVYLVFKVPPFPRVFLPLFAVWMVPAGFAVHASGSKLLTRRGMAFFLPLIWTVLILRFAPQISAVLFQNNDDLLSPYYTRTEFQPSRTVEILEKIRRTNPDAVFFLTFDCDYPSVLFAADWPDGDKVLLFDIPNRPKRTSLPPASCIGVVASTPEDLGQAAKRFGLPPASSVTVTGHQRIGVFYPRNSQN